jgi:hypothetical protein
MSGFEVAGAVGLAVTLVGQSKNVYDFFCDMASGFKDRDGKITTIRGELHSFKRFAKYAHSNLERQQLADNLDLRRCLIRYQNTVLQLGRRLKYIRRQRSIWGTTRKWMKLMKSDAGIHATRRQLVQHRQEILMKFSVSTLVQIRSDTRAVGRNVGRARDDIRAVGRNVGHARDDIRAVDRNVGHARDDVRVVNRSLTYVHDNVREVQTQMQTSFDAMALRMSSSEENLRQMNETLAQLCPQEIQTPAFGPVDLQADDLFASNFAL